MNVRSRNAQGGFTYLMLLVAIALLGVGLSVTGEVWSAASNRQRVADLDWVGNQFVAAIGSYYQGTPGIVVKTYPKSLEDLIRDPRFLFLKRHLRRIYPNPLTGRPDWELVRAPDGGVMGVRASFQVGFTATVRSYVYVPGRSPKVGMHRQ